MQEKDRWDRSPIMFDFFFSDVQMQNKNELKTCPGFRFFRQRFYSSKSKKVFEIKGTSSTT